MNNARNMMANKLPNQAISYLNKILKIQPDDIVARTNLGLCMYEINNFQQAAKIFHELHTNDPNNFEFNKWAGFSYLGLNANLLAHEFLIRALKFNLKDIQILHAITSVLIKLNKETDAIYYATEALSLDVKNPVSHNVLGVCLLELNRLHDALYCFETSLKIDPNSHYALSNKANALDRMEMFSESVEAYKACLANTQNRDQINEIKYKMSLPLLALGKLDEGWDMFEYGLEFDDRASRNPKRNFSAPKWNGEDISEKTILVWREQGLGDEIDHFILIPQLMNICKNIIIECDSRLVSLLQRSFPNCLVRSQSYDPITKKALTSDYDYHTPSGSLARFFLKNKADFNKVAPYLIPDPLLVEKFSKRLSNFDRNILVGICWRSGFNNSSRNINYAPISEWEPILKNKKFKFINLQYGECSIEIENVRENFGVEIINFEDIDLKNDLESVCALMTTLNCVVSAGTAVACLASASGVKMKTFSGRGWALLGEDFRPWSPNSDLYLTSFSDNYDYKSIFKRIAHDLDSI